MKDPMFRAFLVSQAETLRTELLDANLTVPVIMEKATQILKLENRVKRIDNPVQRVRKTAE